MTSQVGKTCPYCQTPVKPGVPIVRCPQCGIVHHKECWDFNKGCTTFGCAARQNADSSPTVSAPVDFYQAYPPGNVYYGMSLRKSSQQSTGLIVTLCVICFFILLGMICSLCSMSTGESSATSVDSDPVQTPQVVVPDAVDSSTPDTSDDDTTATQPYVYDYGGDDENTVSTPDPAPAPPVDQNYNDYGSTNTNDSSETDGEDNSTPYSDNSLANPHDDE